MLSLLILISFLIGLLIIFSQNQIFSKISSITLICSIFFATSGFDFNNGSLQLLESYPWFEGFYVSFGIDNLSFSLIAVSAFFILLLSFSNLVSETEKGLLFITHSMVTGALLATNLVLFFIFFEGMLIPLYFIIGKWGGEKRIFAATKFILYSAFGSVFLLASIIFIYIKGGIPTPDQVNNGFVQNLELSSFQDLLLFLGFFIAFAVKIPLFPFYSWQPLAYKEAPTSGVVFMSAVLSKVGVYGLLRFVFPHFPIASTTLAGALAWIAAITCVAAALVAIRQKDIKLLLAYSSISHLSLCFLGIAAWNIQATTGVAFQLVSHALCTGGLFYLLSFIAKSSNETRIERYQCLTSVAPKLSFLFFVVTFGSIALPLTSGFVGEFLILSGSYRVFPLQTSVAMLSVVFGAIYMLSLMREMFFGVNPSEEASKVNDISNSNLVCSGLIAAAILFLGVYPQALIPKLEKSINSALVVTSENETFRGNKGNSKESDKILKLVKLND